MSFFPLHVLDTIEQEHGRESAEQWDAEVVETLADQKRYAAGEAAEPPYDVRYRCPRCDEPFAFRRAYEVHWSTAHVLIEEN